MSEITQEAKRAYWQANLKLLISLLVVWFLVSHVAGIWLADWLDQFKVPGTDLGVGFWFAQQGSIYVFIVLIAVYVVGMNRLDRRLLDGRKEQESNISDH